MPALAFDLDGTLVDSAPDIHLAANKVFSAKGLQEFPLATVKGFIGNGVPVLVSRLLAHSGLPAEGALQAELVADFLNIYEEAIDLTTLYAGVPEALEALVSTGYRLSLCTNKPAGPARAVLRHFGLDGYFPVVIGGDSLAERKPHPAPLQAALAALGVGPALMIGDSEVDAECAQRAGVPFALFTGGYRKATPESLGAKLIFDDHAALPRLLAHLLPRLSDNLPAG